MKEAECSHCKNSVPVNDSINVDGKTYCITCFESVFTDAEMLEGKVAERQSDPTVCSFCNEDFGQTELDKIGNNPVCKNCEKDIKDRTFPLWVKAFFAGILLIVAFSFYWNWKYYQAYDNIKKATAYISSNEYSNAADLLMDVSATVPEVKELNTLAIYYKGLSFMAEDKGTEALIEFNKCKNDVPDEYNISLLITQATMASCFDEGNYECFLTASKDNLMADSTASVNWASVASAYSCIYVTKNDNSAMLQAYNYLSRAKEIDSVSTEAKEYYNMIDYRLNTRQLIDKAEFKKKFPNGWNKLNN